MCTMLRSRTAPAPSHGEPRQAPPLLFALAMSHLLVRAALLHRADVARLVLGGAAGRVAATVRGGRIFRQAGRAVRGGLLGGCSGAVQKRTAGRRFVRRVGFRLIGERRFVDGIFQRTTTTTIRPGRCGHRSRGGGFARARRMVHGGMRTTGLIVARIVVRHRVGFRVALVLGVARVHQTADGLNAVDITRTNKVNINRVQ